MPLLLSAISSTIMYKANNSAPDTAATNKLYISVSLKLQNIRDQAKPFRSHYSIDILENMLALWAKNDQRFATRWQTLESNTI